MGQNADTPRFRHIDDIPVYAPPGHWGTHNRRLVEGWETGTYEMILGAMEPDGGSQRHMHQRNHQVMFIMSGEAVIELEDASPQRCPAGSVVQIPPGIEHQISAGGRDPLKFIVVFSPPLATEEI